jgi:uncharacterized protein YdeI (YjbR/CyaY-like superfamily)
VGKRDQRVDAYIAKSAEFAKPILRHIREVVHDAEPEIEETIKWGMPHFMRAGIVCSMAAFKAHCALHFWKGSLIVTNGSGDAMGQFGRITQVSDLPPRKVLVGYIKEAVKFRESGSKSPARARPREKKEIEVPIELTRALKKNKRAAAAFKSFPPSHRREYAQWIGEAKREETRKRRVDAAIEWMAEGKSRNWKYEKSAEK